MSYCSPMTLSHSFIQFSSSNLTICEKPKNPFMNFQIKRCESKLQVYPSLFSRQSFYNKSVPLAAAIVFLVWSNPAKAGFLSGFPGIESVPGPRLPEIEFLNRFNEENQKKYAENDERFKSSPIIKELLEKSKLNKEKNRREIEDKYCLRGAEWGVGDCSAEGMSPEEREKFMSMLKEKTGMK